MNLKVAAVIFDMDGLMFDTERIAQFAWQRAAADLGYDYSDTLFRGVIGRNSKDVQRITLEALGQDAPFAEIYEKKQIYLEEYIQQDGLPLKAGLIELLDCLEMLSLPKAVASSSPKARIQRNLQAAGLLEGRFDALVGGDEVRNGKPDPEIFLLASDALDISPEACLVLEDSNAGIQAAHAAGMIPVMVPDILEPTDQSRRLAYIIIPSLHAAVPLIEDNSNFGK